MADDAIFVMRDGTVGKKNHVCNDFVLFVHGFMWLLCRPQKLLESVTFYRPHECVFNIQSFPFYRATYVVKNQCLRCWCWRRPNEFDNVTLSSYFRIGFWYYPTFCSKTPNRPRLKIATLLRLFWTQILGVLEYKAES